jgi:hypothetical protein
VTKPTNLPADVDEKLWFDSAECGGRDYIFDSHWRTFPGRMSAYCPHDPEHPDYRISLAELPTSLPKATRYFVQGFLAGNLPARPDTDSPALIAWRQAALRFTTAGYWDLPDQSSPAPLPGSAGFIQSKLPATTVTIPLRAVTTNDILVGVSGGLCVVLDQPSEHPSDPDRLILVTEHGPLSLRADMVVTVLDSSVV